MQDVFISLFELRNSLNPKISVQAYLYIALKNRILNYYRHQGVQRRYQQYVALQQPAVVEHVVSQLQGKELEIQINKEIKKLPLQCRTVFLLSRKEGLPYKQIATELKISVNTVEQHMRKALRILRTSIGNYLHLLIFLVYLGER